MFFFHLIYINLHLKYLYTQNIKQNKFKTFLIWCRTHRCRTDAGAGKVAEFIIVVLVWISIKNH